MMGSIAYGVSEDTSDTDVYGFCIPPKDVIFPHLRGELLGFGKQQHRFDQYEQHHIKDKEARKDYDIHIYNIVKYFQLVMENNPNMVDSLFVPHRCVLHITKVGNMIRDERKSFLHKGCWHKFKGYAYSQMHKMDTKDLRILAEMCNKHQVSEDLLTTHIVLENPQVLPKSLLSEDLPEFQRVYKACTEGGKLSKRLGSVRKFGYDVKFAYHVVRLLNEVEQILTEKDLDLERNREQLKSIRRGEWKIEQIRDYFSTKERELETVYLSSLLPYSPDEDKIKLLLLSCLEEHYGSLDQAIAKPDSFKDLLTDLHQILDKYRGRI
jgi:predicted nucleotidyltransferase